MSTRPVVCSASASRSGDRRSRPSARARSARSAASSSRRRRGRARPPAGAAPRARRSARSASRARRARREPPRGHGGAGPLAVVLVEPHRARARPAVIAELVEGAVRALARVDALVEAAEPPRRLREHVEALRLRGRVVELAGRARGRGTPASRDERGPRAPLVSPSDAATGGSSSAPPSVPTTVTVPPRGDRSRSRQVGADICAARCSSTGCSSPAGLNSRNVTPSSVQPVWPPGQ